VVSKIRGPGEKKKERTPAKKIQRIFSQNFLFIFGASSKRGKTNTHSFQKFGQQGIVTTGP
jgi:hypothetical protein